MAEQSKKFVIVKFKESWIKCRIDDVKVAVAFPAELTSTNKSLMRTGKEPVLKWKQFPATIEDQVDTYKDGEIKLVLAGAAAPQSPLSLSNLHISEPSTLKTSTPKKLEPHLNTSGTDVETQAPSNETVQVNQQLLVELYQTWEKMNSIMGKLFPTHNNSNCN
ncbi:unnamed protein product [Euphydryas editha]|uniref:Uncharacterized protein n=1 Tax=Euphydryas editha TaxID=104508 RepID=A0AAU9TQ70_EUPED|nr:unnamed protein product [Euphydryas editha]